MIQIQAIGPNEHGQPVLNIGVDADCSPDVLDDLRARFVATYRELYGDHRTEPTVIVNPLADFARQFADMVADVQTVDVDDEPDTANEQDTDTE